MNPCQAIMTVFLLRANSVCCHTQAVYVWKESRTKRGGDVQVKRGAGKSGGRSQAPGTDEWHKPEQLHKKKLSEQ